MQAYLETFNNAAVLQKLIFVILVLAAATVALTTAARLISPTRPPPAFIADLRFAGPLLGLGVAAMNGLHMMQTTARLPRTVTLRMLAPGFMEMAALVQAGALAGLVAVAAIVLLQLNSPVAVRPDE